LHLNQCPLGILCNNETLIETVLSKYQPSDLVHLIDPSLFFLLQLFIIIDSLFLVNFHQLDWFNPIITYLWRKIIVLLTLSFLRFLPLLAHCHKIHCLHLFHFVLFIKYRNKGFLFGQFLFSEDFNSSGYHHYLKYHIIYFFQALSFLWMFISLHLRCYLIISPFTNHPIWNMIFFYHYLDFLSLSHLFLQILHPYHLLFRNFWILIIIMTFAN
jgi:hypothetical protein